MPSNKPQLKTYVDISTYEKFKLIAESEHRSASNYLELLILKEIKEYENKHGNIQVGKIINMGDNNGTINM